MASTAVANVLDRLPDHRPTGAGWTARCPAHDDQHASLSIAAGGDGRVLLRCHAGCELHDVLSALGVGEVELFPSRARATSHPPPGVVARYPYTDEAGTVLFEVLRLDPKGFRQRRPRPDGGWDWSLGDARRVLYRLPRVLDAARRGEAIFVVEGEKDVHALEVLGVTATTNAGGAGKWRPSYAEILRGAGSVIVLPDNDEAGRRHADAVVRSLQAVGVSVKVVTLPGLAPKGDVSDWLAAGGTRERLLDLAQAAPVLQAASSTAPDLPSAIVLRLSDVRREHLAWLWPGRIPRGKLVILDGDPDLGKTTVALDLAARLTRGHAMPGESVGAPPANVLLLMAEDGLGDTVRPRLEASGADLERVYALRGVPTLDGGERLPHLPDDGDVIREWAARHEVAAVFVDPLFAYVSPECSIFRDQDVRRALQPLVRLGEDLGCAVVVLRHLNKTSGGKAVYRGGGSIGIIGAARAGLVVAEDPEDPSRRVLAVVKCNLGARARALAYRLVADDDVARVVWEGPTEHTAAQLLAGPPSAEEQTSGDAAEEFLREALSDGARSGVEIVREARAAGISERTLWRAKTRLGVRAQKEGAPSTSRGRQRWVWSLPDVPPDAEACHDTPKAAMPRDMAGLAGFADLAGFAPGGDPRATLEIEEGRV